MPLTLIAVNLATLAIGSLFYGMYSVLFFISMYLLLRRYNATHTSHKSRKDGSIFKSMVFVSAIFLFLVVTAHWTTIVYRAFIAYVSLQHGAEAETLFNDHAQITEVVQASFLSLSIVIGDSLIIHRLWVVWSHSKIVLVVPVCNLFALTVCTFISTNTTSHSIDVFSNPWLKLNTVLTLITNIYCTGFITWKIWTITRLSMPSDGTNLRHFLVIVVESAGFYAFWAVFFAVAYESKSNIQSSVIQTAPAVVGIVNALIHTRVGLGWTAEQTQGLPWPSSPLRFAVRETDDGCQ
ncbi:hypothetical protein B0H10DRAFT_2050829 [Mycena sp. CBHHK59/15]|nr:hypothetical protein B0H10DRAFT_2050829 [Mycena sp. CBHHK59/15]